MANSVLSNGSRNNCGTHFGPSPLPVSKVAVIINFFGGGGGGGCKNKSINWQCCSTYLLNKGWTFLLNESVKEKRKKKNGGNFSLRVWQNKALLLTCT